MNAASWTLTLASGARLVVAPGLSSMTTYVLLEQERWFESELGWLVDRLQPGMKALDIGANHGVYAIELARRVGARGHVWAFEPTQVPRQRLRASVAANGLDDRLTVVDAALAEAAGTAEFSVHDNSELNSRGGRQGRRETVRLEALDAWWDAAGRPSIDVVKLDAEGSELQVLAGAQRFFAACSPVVMFEYLHKGEVNVPLVEAMQAMGFGIFRLRPELGVLVPLESEREEMAFALNLFGVRAEQQAALAAQGLLVPAGAAGESHSADAISQATGDVAAAFARLVEGPAASVLQTLTWPARDAGYGRALSLAVAAFDATTAAPAQRLQALQGALDILGEAGSAADAAAALESDLLRLRLLHALGRRRAAVDAGRAMLARWATYPAPTWALLPPTAADRARPCTTALGPWLRQCVAEFVALQAQYSSYFSAPRPVQWAELIEHPDHGSEVERRYVLSHVVAGQSFDPERLRLLPSPASTSNPVLWRGVIEATRADRAAAAAAAAASTAMPAEPQPA